MADETIKTEVQDAQPDYKALYEEAQREGERLKNALNKTSSEVAKYKKDLADRMTEQERAEAERKAADEEKDRLIAEYKAEKRISSYQAKIMAAGFSADTASVMAKALPDGVQDSYFDELRKHNEETTAKARADALNAQPKLTSGGIPQTKDRNAEIDDMLRAKGLL